jgi:hypothetical protein
MLHSTQKAVVLAAFWTVLALPALATVTVAKTADLAFGKLVPHCPCRRLVKTR